MNEADFFDIAKEQLQKHYDEKYARKLKRNCMLCSSEIPWGYIELQGVIMCDECFQNLGLRCKVCE